MNSFKKMAITTVCFGLTAFSAAFAEAGDVLEYSYGTGALKISGTVPIYEGETDTEIGASIAADIGDLVPIKGKSETHNFEYAGTWSRDSVSQKFVPDFTASPRTFSITYNIPEGAVVEDLLTSYTYGDSVLLPKASMEGWKFVNWMGSLALVDRIVEGEFDDKVFTAVFSRNISVFTGVDSIEVEIWQVDNDSAISAKIDKYIARYEAEVAPIGKTMDSDSVYTIVGWTKDENGVYTPEFKVELKTPEEVTIVAAFKNPEGESIQDTLVVFSTDEDSVIDRKIAESLTAKGIPMPQKADDDIYCYKLSEWKKNGSTGMYEPIFLPAVKSLMVKAIYGESRKEFIWVSILVTDTEADIAQKISTAVTENAVEPNRQTDDLFLYDMLGWLNIGDDTYVPKFRAIAKPFSARVMYDVEKDSYVTIVIRATDTGSDIEKNIAEALGDKPMPTKASTDKYDYTFCGWNKDLVEGVYVFTPDFDSTRVEDDGKNNEDAIRAVASAASLHFTLDGRTLEITGVAGRVQVFDMRGRKVLESPVNGSNSRLEFPRAGLYVVKAGGDTKRFVIK